MRPIDKVLFLSMQQLLAAGEITEVTAELVIRRIEAVAKSPEVLFIPMLFVDGDRIMDALFPEKKD